MFKLYRLFYLGLMFTSVCNADPENINTPDPLTQVAEDYLRLLASPTGIGVREAGSKEEIAAADFIQTTLKGFGYEVQRQNFNYVDRKTKTSRNSQNIIAQKAGKSGKNIIIGGHYDAISGKLGSLGAVDNAASIAVILALAKQLSESKIQKYGVTFIAFGAEEVGLVGSTEFVRQSSAEQINSYIGMVNLDGIVGSDNLYMHSAHSTPYRCSGDTSKYTHDSRLRDQLFKIASNVTANNTFQIHPGFAKYPAGETGGWTDHAPFACVGLPIANFESTNFAINGRSGKDGYSQSIHPSLWNCFNQKTMGACDRKTEKKWGQIWHTKNDRLDVLEKLFPGRIRQHMSHNLKVLSAFTTQLDTHIEAMINNQ